ncbi:MAG: aminodeoxychorismate synthase component I [Gammaproteobacteria bacterium]|nr:aminodeoxychorismate synthase component I [Gammaproteobacteria bacterium]
MADHCAPDSDLLALHALHPARYPYLLESVVHGTPAARYDILFAFPGATLELADLITLRGPAVEGTNFLAQLDRWWSAEQQPRDTAAAAMPFRGGWFAYLGYELAAQIEPSLKLPTVRSGLPVAFATRIPAAIVRDHLTQSLHLIAEPGSEDLLARMREDVAALEKSTLEASMSSAPLAWPGITLQEDSPREFLDGVERILRYIREGDVFQVNLSRIWRGRCHASIDAAQVYRRLREYNPAPFAGLACHGASAIISSSPERLVQVRGGVVTTRPIAGTRPRRENHSSDGLDTAALLAHPKERAEHIMLIDLERNDMGRVCVPGSVRVDELMSVESYAHVHHIVSGVRGELRPGTTPGEVLRAVFPGGTITGCPKVRCMEIIAELERVPRGAYTGAMGYLNRDGDMDFNILIRTLIKEGDDISLRAGAGIVADSSPQRELEETRAKARGLLRALGSEP